MSTIILVVFVVAVASITIYAILKANKEERRVYDELQQKHEYLAKVFNERHTNCRNTHKLPDSKE